MGCCNSRTPSRLDTQVRVARGRKLVVSTETLCCILRWLSAGLNSESQAADVKDMAWSDQRKTQEVSSDKYVSNGRSLLGTSAGWEDDSMTEIHAPATRSGLSWWPRL